jgi:cytochrome b6-f complex iron-sulfur subunit
LTAKPLPTDSSRRQVLCGLVVGLLAPGALAAACGDNGTQAGGTTTTTPNAAATTTSGGGGSGGAELAKLSAVPVGGGILVNRSQGKVLIVQPSAGTVKAYDPTCTHQGTTVNPPQGNVITCPNHGSQYNATDGSVKRGPAPLPLKEIPVRVQGDAVVMA